MPNLTLRIAIEALLLEFADSVEEYCDEEDGLDIQGLRGSLDFGEMVGRLEAMIAGAVARADTPKQGEPGFTMDEVVEGGDHVEN